MPETEERHSFSHSFKINLLRICYIPGTILSPKEGYTYSLEDQIFWQRHPMNEEINTDAFQWGCVLCRKNCEVGGITLGRVARKGLFEEVTYLGLRVPVWRGSAIG